MNSSLVSINQLKSESKKINVNGFGEVFHAIYNKFLPQIDSEKYNINFLSTNENKKLIETYKPNGIYNILYALLLFLFLKISFPPYN